MIVPVVFVCRVTMTVVYVVGVVVVRNRDMAAVRPVSVVVPVVHPVLAALALVGVLFVAAMEVTVVDVVEMVFVGKGDVPAARPVVMRVIGMDVVHSRQGLHVLVLQARDAVPAARVSPDGPQCRLGVRPSIPGGDGECQGRRMRRTLNTVRPVNARVSR